MPIHREMSGEEIHVPYAWEYAGSTAREAETGMTADDVGRLALQEDDDSLWLLTDNDPLTWVQVGGGVTPTESAEVGQWTDIMAGSYGGTLSLPAGGTWAWIIIMLVNSSGQCASVYPDGAGVDAGGTQIFAGQTGYKPYALAWRIA